jgi:hypothetical protein
MSTLLAPLLSDSLQALIDLRLDTLDRMLIGHVSRQDRVNIVAEVETQIFELLAQRGENEPTRDDLLAVLAQLDPPEAYVPSDNASDAAEHAAEQRVARRGAQIPRTAAPSGTRLAKPAGITGLAALGALMLLASLYLMAALSDGELFLILAVALLPLTLFSAGVTAVVPGLCARLRGAWAIIGVVAGGLTAMLCLSLGALMVAFGI